MNWTKYITADKDRSMFFTGITVLGSAAAVVSVSNELYTLTAMSAGAAIVGVIGLISKAVIELTAPVINTAIQSMTGRFKKFDHTPHHQ